MLDELDGLISSLNQQPELGHYPPELAGHGIKDYREVLFKPYRVIYQVINNHVVEVVNR